MLAPEEFTVGTFSSAPAGSLILPRQKHEATAIVGLLNEVPIVVFLGNRFRFHSFPTASSHNWSGLIIPTCVLRSMNRLRWIRLMATRLWGPW